ncbi:Protein CBG25738 [Caenorhabditis briggsae]|uniref:Uncharacterized protein n=2 Tax=Caenorhabditis briggsae TaxID=6238 RepID=A0AAE8ZXH8_CAEBR|nr:Protein CBG25738 [Caenorhabditis briggsae]ULT85109.1 hypothetical protein L3Y34_013664 [Caenorhabditis briggsae]UMM44326.1 hypothetical protein L5515_019489 [Caenorhabditis briggsae]CAR99439.1 Protein CBG25738 [Caenorhabditis briggsae]
MFLCCCCCRRVSAVTPGIPRGDIVELATVPENVPGTTEPVTAPEAHQAVSQGHQATPQVHQSVVEERVVPANVIMVKPKPDKAHASIGRQSSAATMMGLKEALKEIKKPGVNVLEDPTTKEVAEKITEPTLVSRKKKLESLKKQDSVDPEDD